MGVEGDPVDDGGDEAGVGDDLAPFAERQVRGHGDGGFLFSFGEDLEQQFGASGVELDVAELVEAEQVESAVAGDDARQASVVGGFGEFVDQLGGGGVADPASLLAGGDAEPDEEMAFPGAGVAEQDDGLAGVEVAAGGQGGDGGRVDGRGGGQVEIGEAFDPREAGFADASVRRRSLRSSTSAERTSARNAR